MRCVTTETELNAELAAHPRVVLDCHAKWCGPCKLVGPTLQRLEEEDGGAVLLLMLDVDDGQDLAAALNVRSLPTVCYYRFGKIMARVEGADISGLNGAWARLKN